MSSQKRDSVHTSFDGYTIQDGQLVSERVQRIIMAIYDYSPELEVIWIPDRQAKEQNVPQFKIVHRQPDGHDFVLFHVEDEEKFDETILQRIIVNDQRNGTTDINEYEAWERTQKLVGKQVWLDKLEEAADISKHIINSPLHDYKVDKDLRIVEGIPFNANKIRDPKFFSHGK